MAVNRQGCAAIFLGSLVFLWLVGYCSAPSSREVAEQDAARAAEAERATADSIERHQAQQARADSLVAATSTSAIRKLPDSLLTLAAVYATSDSAKIKAAQAEQTRREEKAEAEAARARIKTRSANIKELQSCGASTSRISTLVARHPSWDDVIIAHVACRSAAVGMTAEQAIAAWGRADDVNRTTSAYGVREQWVYEDYNGIPRSYLYFEDGVLTTVQN